MRISILGLGYVGCVSAACLAHEGHAVVGVDVNPTKVDLIGAGRSPIVEPGLDELIAEGVATGRLRATLDTKAAVHETELSLICVGTPSNANGSLNLKYVEGVCREIGEALASKDAYHVVVIRSTVLPGTVLNQMLPILEAASGKKVGEHFGLSMNPEFLRESSAIADYYSPSHIVIGEYDERSGDMVEALYKGIDAPLERVSIPTAEMVKYVDNAFHALKVVFANEIGSVCKAHEIDGRRVMEIFCQDTRLNLSPAYLRPGYAFGGSCLPKDLRALTYRTKERDIDAPMLNSLLLSNQYHIQRGIHMVEQAASKEVGILGLSFKANTDDVRESPMVVLIETLVGRGFHVRVYDEHVHPDRLIGANREFLLRELPHIVSLMSDTIDHLLADVDTVVIANGSAAFRDVPGKLRQGQTLIDLVGIVKHHDDTYQGSYDGICW
ncbi:MAG: UDP-glucose/GDP-mannose dehydrogenase family protein [Chloroflexaceae bacterium]|nr:UDP-glucose/GDP-mannose dehydrogenase family protein [Chloroflexaceae bacterium]NJO05061.1 UDP-glucose/GDP-mannose dehydrogenase family protein [Chloroflexaceae bacterium]